MLKVAKNNIFVLIFFVFLSVVLFRNYFLNNQVPFPANLQAAFYSPWKYEKWEGYPNGPANKPIGFDVLKLFYPYRKYTTERLKQGEVPLWNPYVFSGNVHLATYQSAVFYPLNLIYFLLPTIDAWSMLVIIQPILAGYFMYLFLRLINLRLKSSLFGSVVFALSGWMIAWSEESLVIEHSALWLPVVLYGVESLFIKNYTRGFLSCLAGFTLSILAGFLQMTLYIGIFSLAWTLYRYYSSKIRDKKELIFFIYSAVASILIASIHLAPALESYFYSPRGVVNAPFIFETYLMRPWHLFTFLVPDFWGNPGSYNYFGHGGGFYHEKVIFIGIPALLLALYALFSSSPKSYLISFFKWSSIITLLLGFFPFGWLLYYFSLPIISAMVPSRIFFLTSFSLSVLASMGMESLLHKKWDTSVSRKITLVISLVFICLWFFVLAIKIFPALQEAIDPKSNFSIISFRNLVIPTAIFVVCTMLFTFFTKWKSKLNIFYFSFLVISILSSLYFGHKFLYFSERQFVFAEVPAILKVKELAGLNRVWGYGNGYIEKNMLSYYNIYSSEGYDALYSQRYGELFHSQEENGKFTNQISRTDATFELASEKQTVLDHFYRSRLLQLTGTRFIIEAKQGENKETLKTEDRFPKSNFELSWEDDNFRIWEYKDAFPRAFLVTDYIVDNESKSVIEKLYNSSFDIGKTVIVEKDPGLFPCEPNRVEVKILEYKPEKVQLKAGSDCDTLLFLSDTYYPGWKAKVNEKETPIIRANHTFRSIVVPAGEHIIEFTYTPKAFTIGMWATLFSLIIVIPVWVLIKKYVLHTAE